MKRKVLMVYPEIPTTYWSFRYALEYVNYRSMMPPLGLLTIASLLPDNYEVKLIDMNVKRLNRRDIQDSDIVFISAMIIQKDSFHQVVKWCNECNKPVAAGGAYPTSSYSQIEGVDYFILNEGEITLPKFIKDYERGCPQKLYRDVTKPDIGETPVPRFDLIDVNDYGNMALQFSRGCPFNCEFCDIIEMFGRKPRTKMPEQFIHEMDCVYDTGYRGPLFIVDDNFIGNKRRVKELLRRIVVWQREHDYPFQLYTEASINLAQDDALMDLMVVCGFSMVFLGIETPDYKTLEHAQKHQNARTDIFESVKVIQERGIEVLGGFILGFDTDPENIFDLQIEFIQKAGIPLAMVGLLVALPDTRLYRRLQRENRLLGDTHGNNTHELEMNFIPMMPKQRLLNGYKRIISEIYSPVKYFDRSITLLKRMPKRRFVSRPISKRDLKAFFRSLVRQSFSRYGWEYLRFLIRALRYNRWNFHLAVSLAIKGYHFFKITDDILRADEFSSMLIDTVKSLEKRLVEFFEGRTHMGVTELRNYVIGIRGNLKKKYRRQSASMQQYLYKRVAKFESFTEQILKWQERMYHYVASGNSMLLDLPREIKKYIHNYNWE
jgi:radical SAM superfamily enzyme YgiQ (UPF0313 family)